MKDRKTRPPVRTGRCVMVAALAISLLVGVVSGLVVAVRTDEKQNPSRDWHSEVPAGDER